MKRLVQATLLLAAAVGFADRTGIGAALRTTAVHARTHASETAVRPVRAAACALVAPSTRADHLIQPSPCG